MKETINNIHVISKGIIFSIILHMIVVGFLVVTGFSTSILFFTIILFTVMAISGFYIGTISGKYAEINGILLAIFTSSIVLLYIAQYTATDWAVNRIIIASYIVAGFLSAWLTRLTNKKQKNKEKYLTEKKPKTRIENKYDTVYKEKDYSIDEIDDEKRY